MKSVKLFYLITLLSFANPFPIWAVFQWSVIGGDIKPGGKLTLEYDISTFQVAKNRTLRGLKSLKVIFNGDAGWEGSIDFKDLDDNSTAGRIEIPIPAKADISEAVQCSLDFTYKTSNQVSRKVPIKDKRGKVTSIEHIIEYREHRFIRHTQPILLDFQKQQDEVKQDFSYLPSLVFLFLVILFAFINQKFRKKDTIGKKLRDSTHR
ncbi:hypothetical protein ACFL35_20405 [Candidatus Riflebacteria bacterium]